MICKTRLEIEAADHPGKVSFVTLTYHPDFLSYAIDGRRSTLIPNDLKLWLYRFRQATKPSKLRYYAIGEYGGRFGRPHYHIMLYGYEPCLHGGSRYKLGPSCCSQCDRILRTWDKGIIECKPANEQNFGYIAGYVMEKMTKNDVRLEGRFPEFTRQSNGGGRRTTRENFKVTGLGSRAALWLADDPNVAVRGDVASHIRFEGKNRLVGRYIRRKARQLLGGDGSAPDTLVQILEEEMFKLRAEAKKDPQAPSLKHQVLKANAGARAAIMARQKSNRKNGDL